MRYYDNVYGIFSLTLHGFLVDIILFFLFLFLVLRTFPMVTPNCNQVSQINRDDTFLCKQVSQIRSKPTLVLEHSKLKYIKTSFSSYFKVKVLLFIYGITLKDPTFLQKA